jgi:hypothetical protein
MQYGGLKSSLPTAGSDIARVTVTCERAGKASEANSVLGLNVLPEQESGGGADYVGALKGEVQTKDESR